MIERLVVNGCSYAELYARGRGHNDLAQRLEIPNAESLAQSGCNNSRILRTTIKDSYATTVPTLYVLGMTFVSRYEIPILTYPAGDSAETSFEGRWTNPQNQMYSNRWESYWTVKDTDNYVKMKDKANLFGFLDLVEDLMYRMSSTANDLRSRGHRVLMYQQADVGYQGLLHTPRLALFKTMPWVVNGFNWNAIQWQHDHNVPVNPGEYDGPYGVTPENMRHRKPGEHHLLNKFLTNYIDCCKILE